MEEQQQHQELYSYTNYRLYLADFQSPVLNRNVSKALQKLEQVSGEKDSDSEPNSHSFSHSLILIPIYFIERLAREE